jgi:hypothetical protein
MKQFVIRAILKEFMSSDSKDIQTFEEAYERQARLRYEELTRVYPNIYFELLLVEHNETCLEFTKNWEM